VLSQTSARGESPEATFAYFDVGAGKRLWVLPRKGQQFAFSPDGKTVVSATFKQAGYQIIETDSDSGKPAERFQRSRFAHPNVRLLFAPDSRTVVINHFDGVATWNVRTGDETVCFKPPQPDSGWGPELGAISADGRTLLTNLGHLQRWDLTTGKSFFETPPDDGLGGPIEHLAFTPNGKEVIAASWSINSGRWEVATGTRVAFTRDRLGRQLITTPGGLRALRCDSYKSPHEVAVLDPVAGKVLQTVGWAAPTEVGINGLRSYALTADGKSLLVAHGDEPGPPAKEKSYVTACDLATGRRLARFAVAGSLYFPNSPFSPCGRWVVLAGKVYHVATGTALFAPAGAPGEPGERLIPGDRVNMSPVWFSDDGRLLAGRLSGKQGAMLAVWELASGTVLARFPEAGHVAQVAFAPDGRTLALLDGWGVHVHNLPTGKRLAAYPAADVLCDSYDRGCGTQNLTFAPDGRTLATGHLDGAILLWKVPSLADSDPQGIADSDRDGLWADLGSDSPTKALAAVKRLVGRPARAVALLRSRFQPSPTSADPVLAALVADLDSDVFATREAATRKLKEQGAKAEPVLRRALASPASIEMKRRIEDILVTVPPPPLRLPLAGDTLRGVRAIEVLERVGTPEARQLLHAWADQTRDLHLAAEARAALGRAGRAGAKDEAPRR
jgi:WD40 repeat protein